MIMDRRMEMMDLLLLILGMGLWSTASTTSRTLKQGSPTFLQKRSISSDNECLQLQVATDNQLHEFGTAFAELASGLNNISDNFTGDVILFLGNTGVGKSSLVHLLAGESANFVAKEDGVDSGNFYIEDISEKFVKNSTIDSTTIYPEAVEDATSGAVFVDTPGFRDTRSTIHEIVATYGLHKVASMSHRIKIALLVDYNSLTPQGSRDDFTNALESFFNMFNNTQKFQNSTYLIATKTENRYNLQGSEIVPVPPETTIKAINQFLNGAAETLENRKGKYGNEVFISNGQKLIARLEKKVALFMKPDREGPILGSLPLQRSLQTIRNILLVDEGYVTVSEEDLGFAISDKARVYIRNLYDLMNSHVKEVSKSFIGIFEKFMIRQLKTFDNIEEIQRNLEHLDHQVKISINKTKTSTTPSEYIDAVKNLTSSVNMGLCSQNVFDEIKKLSAYLDDLKKITDHVYYTPSEWTESLNSLQHLVQNEMNYYSMLDNLYNKITDNRVMFSNPTIRAIQTASGFRWKDLEEFKNFLKQLGLLQPANVQITPEKLVEIALFVKKVVGQQSRTCYRSNTVLIVNSVLRTSDLGSYEISTCSSTSTVVLVATRKLYIDASIGTDVMKGRNLVVIAPEWHTMGMFTLSLDGESAEDPGLSRAARGKEGLHGKAGQHGGNFVGVALKYFNSELLTISTSGGNGSPGQDGGHGRNGRDGKDGTRKTLLDDSAPKYSLFYREYKTRYLYKADYGTKGGDAGRGGLGGRKGYAGSQKMYSLSQYSQDRSTHRAYNGREGDNGSNGRPGRGGYRGCDKIQVVYDRQVLFRSKTSKKSEFVNCDTRENDDGILKSRSQSAPWSKSLPPSPPEICEIFKEVKHHFEAYDDIVSHSSNIEFRKAFDRKFICH